MSILSKVKKLFRNISKRENITMFTLVDVYMAEHDSEEELEMNLKESRQVTILKTLEAN